MQLIRGRDFFDDFQPRNIHGKICGAGQISLSVNPYGEVFPCNGFSYHLGNIKETSIIEIWNGDKLREIYDLRFDQLSRCVNCRWRDDCVYCLGSALAENGSIFIPVDENCKISCANYEFRLESTARL